MCEEESDDSEAVAKLLEINDSIHRTVERYKLTKKGDVEAASKIPKGTLGTSTGVGKNAANELSLIDFDPESSNDDGNQQAGSNQKATTVEDDLLGLSIDDRPSGQLGGIALGFGANSGVPGPPLLSSTMQQNRAAPPVTTSAAQPARPYNNAFSSFTGSQLSSKPASPSPVQQQGKTITTSPASSDPFASLVAPGSRSSSPFNRPAPTKSAPTSSLLDLADKPTQSEVGSQNRLANDEEWNFASSLPESTLPASNRVEVHSSSIKIEFVAMRPAGQQSIRIMAQFSNNTASPLRGLHFQVAVEKACFSPLPLSSPCD